MSIIAEQTFTGAGTMVLPGKLGVVSRWLVHIDGTAWTGSVTPSGKAIGGEALAGIELAYINQATGAAVAAGSAPTDDALILLDGTGIDITLTVVSSGSVTIRAVPVVG